MSEHDTDVDVPDPEQAGNSGGWPSRPDPARCLADAAMDAALTDDMRMRLAGTETLAVVVRVPSAAWVAPIQAAFQRLNDRAHRIARDGKSRTGHNADSGNAEVAGDLALGRTVVGIAPSVAILPRALTAAADLTIEVGMDGDVIGDAIARFSSLPPAPQPIEGVGALDFHDVVSGFRAGSSSYEIVERLQRSARRLASPRDDRLPDLVDAVEYGPARDWGLRLGHQFSDYQNHRIQWNEVGANALFGGDPGLGKTFFARILAHHLGISLIPTSISEIFATSAGYLDSIIKSVREVFARAEASAPAAILWDELDALPSRVNLNDRNSSWWTPVVGEFLLLLDSAVSSRRKGVFVWAATNHPHRIDPALLRPGRLDRVIHFEAPGPDGIASIARHHLAGELAGVDLTEIGQLGLGRTPAEIAAAVKSARSAARAAGRRLEYNDLVEALAPRAHVDDATLRRIAIHEAGHAVIAIALDVDEVVAIDVAGDAGAFGRTVLRRRGGIELRASIENRTVAQLGGRAAEALIYNGDCAANAGGDPTSDLALATEAAAALRVSMGLGDAGGLAYLGDAASALEMLRLDPTLRAAVDGDLARLHARAVDIVRRHRAALEAIAAALAERRHLSGDAVRRIYARHPPME
ncbi:AAA family ATPase [Bradyrhizobium japonicum]|nr:AAA family ATPase [Bradyrhizobium japonicum]